MTWGPAVTALGVALFSAIILLPVAIRLAVRYDILDRPGKHKRHKRSVPIAGGTVLFVSFWLAIGSVALFFPQSFDELWLSLPYILAGSLMIYLVGFSDDLKPLSAWSKLLVEVAAGFVLCAGGLKIDPLTVPFVGSVVLGHWSILITVLWVVGLSNAMNLIDGLDGLAAGVSLIGALSLAVVGGVCGIESVVIIACSLIGFSAVFLRLNRHPARVFLGDSGSLQLGYYFAVISLLVPIRTYTAAALYLPLMTLGVPILETVVAFSRRLMSGRSIIKADRRHLFHYLALAGLSPRRIVVLFYSVSAVFGLFAVAALYLDQRWVFGFLALFMVVISASFYIFMAGLSRRGKRLTHTENRHSGDTGHDR